MGDETPAGPDVIAGGRTSAIFEALVVTERREGITRRSALAGAAAAGAATLIHPAAALAGASRATPPVFSRLVGSVDAQTGELTAPHPFSLLGVEWAAPANARIELRTRPSGGPWSPWFVASHRGHAPDRVHAAADLSGDPIWTGPADLVQLRTSRPLERVRLHFVALSACATAPGIRADTATAFPLAEPLLDAGPGQPPIIAREAWSGGRPPAVPPAYGTVKLAFVHNTINPNGYGAGDVPAMLLAMYQFHRFVRGWNDLGYNFVVDLYGRIWEAREGGIDQAVVGAQAGAYNAVSTGAAVLGTFMDVIPSDVALKALERLLAWKLSLHGVPTDGAVKVRVNPADAFYTPFKPGQLVSLPRVAGHRDGDATDCPGNAFYGHLPVMRTRITHLAGAPSQLVLSARPAGTVASALNAAQSPAIAPATIALQGRLRSLTGGAVAGASVELQELPGQKPATLQTLITAADGSFSATVELTRDTALQAVYRNAPAAVSDLAQIEIAPLVELTVESTSPLFVSGTVAPVKRRVTVELYRRNKVIATAHVPVRAGRFHARLARPRPGRYRVIARTAAAGGNAAGASKPVGVSV